MPWLSAKLKEQSFKLPYDFLAGSLEAKRKIMPDWIKPDKLRFKIGSLEWMNFFGLPSFLILISLINAYFYFNDMNHSASKTFLIGFVLTLVIGFISYKIQQKRLNYKVFKLNTDLLEFKEKARQLLKENHWEIDYDNKQFIQATFRGNIFNLDMLTLRFKKDEIQWNIIHHPGSHNSIAAVLTLNRQGKKMIKKIIASSL